MRFTYKRGHWEDGSELPDWQDDEEFEDYLQRIGYGTVKTLFGNEHGSQIEIYESSSGSSFYASVSPSGGSVYEVFLPDFPSYMMFVRDHAAAFSAESANSHQQETYQLLETFFQIQHGHSAHSICPECDPAGWERNAKASEERRKKRESAGS
jgi:hypothetical protein